MSANAISYELLASLKRHIDSLWGGDVYELDGTQSQVAFCPDDLVELLTFEDSNEVNRIFGPSTVNIGRVQEDLMSLGRNIAVPSVFIELSSNDPDSIEAWRDSMYGSFDSSQKLDRHPLILVGGANRYFRRLVIKMTSYFIDADLSDVEVARLGCAGCSFLQAIVKGYTTVPKEWAWKMLDENGVTIKDPFNESAWRCVPVITHNRRRGGPPNDYIWDTKIYVEIATDQE